MHLHFWQHHWIYHFISAIKLIANINIILPSHCSSLNTTIFKSFIMRSFKQKQQKSFYRKRNFPSIFKLKKKKKISTDKKYIKISHEVTIIHVFSSFLNDLCWWTKNFLHCILLLLFFVCYCNINCNNTHMHTLIWV